MPRWPSRAVWAHVTANEHDPQQQGRIQVEFEWEHLDPQASGERAWLHTLTPYGGGSGGGKKSAQYAGFYSLPEVGERVLVEFLGDWDSEAVVIGVVRQHPQGKMAFESQIEAGRHSVTINSGGNPSDMIHFEGTNAGARLDISVATDLYMQAGRHIEIEGHSVTMRATGPGGIQLEAKEDGIGVRSITKGVTVQGQTGVSLKAPGEKVALEGGAGVTVHAKGGKVELRGGPDVEINVNPIPEIPDMPATQ